MSYQQHEKALKELIKDFPQSPGVYLMKNKSQKVIYVGKAKNLRARVRSYFSSSKNLSVKTQYLVNQIAFIDYVLTKTEVEAFLLEASLIKKYRPRYNIRLKDDKSYPYIRCSIKDDFPRFYLARKVINDGSYYFGPYTSSQTVKEMIQFLNRTFKIRDCSDAFMKNRSRPCLTYQIGRCTAPCVGFVSKETYGKDVKSALNVLRGQNKKARAQIEKKMFQASREERFEAAARWRDSLQALDSIWERQRVVAPAVTQNQDVLAFFGDERGLLVEMLYLRQGRLIGNKPFFLSVPAEEDPREWLTSFLNQYYNENIVPDEIYLPVDLGEDLYRLMGDVFKERQGKVPRFIYVHDQKGRELLDIALDNARSHFLDAVKEKESLTEALKTIQKKLHLPALPVRMECFDISHFQGSETVASQVVFENGEPLKEDYRRYRLRDIQGLVDDYASMKEVLTRRFLHTEYEDPQLLVIDGGKGQLNVVVRVLKELGRTEIPVVALAKARTERSFKKQSVDRSEERFFLPNRQNPVLFSKNSQAYRVLVSLRDEAHRFAVSYHRKLRERAQLRSELDAIEGLGEKRKKILLTAFGSVEQIKKASVEEVAALESFNTSLAERVLSSLNKDS